jgi:hypothetical protein
MPSGFVLLSWQEHHGTELPEALTGNWAPKLLLPTVLALLSAAVSQDCTPWSPCGKSDPKTLTALSLCYLMLEASAVDPGSSCPKESRLLGPCSMVGTIWFKPAGLAAPGEPSSCHRVPGDCHHTPKWNQFPDLANLLVPGGFNPHSVQRPRTPHCPWQEDSPCSPIKEWECPTEIPHWGEESCNLLLCKWHQKLCSPKEHRSPALYTAPSCRTVTTLLSMCSTMQSPSASYCNCKRAPLPL